MPEPIAELTTERLRLRPAPCIDPDELVAVFDDVEILRWLTGAPCPYTRADADELLARQETAPSPAWAICDARGLAGIVSLENGLGYWLARRAWGRGYATEACAAAVAAWFAEPDNEVLTSAYFLGNAASARVLEKLGFRDVGPCSLDSRSNGRKMPSRRMRLTRVDWLARQV